jgi:TolB-like protein/Tfp pilus assembly protein PilF
VNPQKFLIELRRRNVYKVAVAYVVVAWLLLQALSILLPAFDAPPWVLRVFIAAIAAGFPLALLFAWAFELTPEGIKRTEEVEPQQSMVTRRRGSKVWVALVLGAALLSIALFFVGRFTAKGTASSNRRQQQEEKSVPEKSVAVLPFTSLSKDEENAFFADGVQDQILTNLAKVAGLKVISRTSVMQYRNPAARNLREIAEQLGVVHVLEGSVQRAKDKVRVTAQLIDARNDAHEWAENYDRPIDDVFAIQTEIAKAIVEQLQVRISPREEAAMAQAPTTDLAAYNLYLKARELRAPGPNDPNGKRDLLEAVRLASEAVARDPKFFLAYCLLAGIHDDLYWAGFDHTPARLALEREAIEKAAQLQSDAGELHLTRALYAYHAYRDYERARAELARAGKMLPNDAGVCYYTAIIDRRQGRWDESLRNFDRTLELDPRNFLRLDEAGSLYQGLRRYSEATALFERALAIRPDYYFVRAQIATMAYLERADIRPLKELARSGATEQPDWRAKTAADLFLCGLVERDRALTMDALAAMPAEGVQDTGSHLLIPREWFGGLAARVSGDEATAKSTFASARSALERIVQAQPEYAEAWSYLGLIDAGLGRKDDAIAEGRRACELRPVAADALNGPLVLQNLAQIYAWTGEKGQALEQLRVAAKLPFGINYGELKLHPAWDPLRGDPRFEKIVASLAPKDAASPTK